MKKIVIKLCFLLICINATAQIEESNTIKPLETFLTSSVQDGDYFKDVNNLLEPFTGVWTGNYDNNVLEIEINKLEHQYLLGMYEDKLIIHYKITNAAGEVLINTFNDAPKMKRYMKGIGFADETNTYIASYVGELVNCNQKGRAVLKMLENGQMRFWIIPDHDIIDNDCPKGNIHIMPTSHDTAVILTKQ